MPAADKSWYSHQRVESFVIFLCFVVFGGASAGLGAAFPQISDDIDNDGTLKYSVLGRGLGFLCGLLCSLFIISKWNSSWFVWCMVALNMFSSCFTFALAFIADMEYYQLWLVVFPFFQGFGFASCDAVGNQFLLEKWRDVDGGNAKGQSWVHIVHAGFTGGGLIGPLLVGSMGYKLGFMVLGLLCLVPLLLLTLSSIRTGSFISHHTPSTAAPPMHDMSGKKLNPIIVYGLEIWFFFLMGQEIAFSSWISSYVIDAGVSTSDAEAAYASSAFYAAMLVGRVAMGLSSTIAAMPNVVVLKGFINFQFISSLLLLIFAYSWRSYESFGYWVLIFSILIFGLSVNSLIGMGINMIEDHACLRWEKNLIVKEIIGLSVGEVVLPVLVGVIYHELNPYTLMVSLFVMAVLISALYFYIEHLIFVMPEDSKYSGYEAETTNPLIMTGSLDSKDTGEKWLANLWVWNGPRHEFWEDDEGTVNGEVGALRPRGKGVLADPAGKVHDMSVTVSFEADGVQGAHLFWEDTDFGPLVPGEQMVMNSFSGHSFNARLDEQVVKTFIVPNSRDEVRFILHKADLNGGAGNKPVY